MKPKPPSGSPNKCCMCGAVNTEQWNKRKPRWMWHYGFNPNIGDGVVCSDECQDAWLDQY